MDMDRYIGRLLDNRYEILEVIGTGGMAVVYKARCHRLNRLVAIKILKDEYSRDEEFRRRFHAEGEAVAMLSHPNIVQVYDVSSSDNADYIVMELIDGITLKQYMEKKGVLNWKETLHFSMQIAKALEHAHGRSIVHRDIKPHNVMVLKNGSVKVTDFGIARVMSKSNTLTKEALGSVHYISPEQAKGGWVDNRSDLYSLGVVMYEMMTGRPPYDGESPVAVAIQHINGGAPMPSTLNPNIPGGLEQIIMKAMALEAKDRYASATEMLADMEEFRKNPAILFYSDAAPVDDATKLIETRQVLDAAARQARTLAEKAAGNAAGTGQRPKNSTPPQREKNDDLLRTHSQEQPRPRTGETPRSRTGELPRPRTGEKPRTPSNLQRTAGGETRRSQSNHRQPGSRRSREEIREEIREEERNRMATIAIVACSLVAIVAIVIFLVALFNGGILNQNANLVKVPQMVGNLYENVRDTQGLVIEILRYEYNDEAAKGIVLDQTPKAGEEVAEGTTVRLTVSQGPEPEVKVMENLVNQPYETAEKFLVDQGMAVLRGEEFSETVEAGRVTRTDPEHGTELKDGQTVWVYVSKGPVIVTETMIKVVGLNYSTAYNQLRSLGFTDVTYEAKEDDAKKDTVIAQSVEPNTEVDVTTHIVLTISKGPKPTEKPTKPPTDPPTEAPTTPPTAAPTTPPTAAPTNPQETTVRRTFQLPTDRTEDYVLSLKRNGKEVLEPAPIAAGTKEIVVELTGSGTQEFELYINGELYKKEKVEFVSNG